MKKMMFVVILSVVILLSSCSGGKTRYKDYSIGEYKVYYNRAAVGVMCDMISGPLVFFYDGDTHYMHDESFGNCARSLFIEHDGERYSFGDAFRAGYITSDEIWENDWDFGIYEAVNIFNVAYKQINFLDDDQEQFFTIKNQDVLDMALANSALEDTFLIGYELDTSDLVGYIELIDNDGVKTTITVYSNIMTIEENNSSSWEYYSSPLRDKFDEELNK